jgi:hypothetical protein
MVGILKGTSQTLSLKASPRTTRHVVVVNESTDNETMIANHRSLHRYITNLLDDARVSALETILIQDNASILAKAASQSARVARDRLALSGRDHFIITKEISRWESYPFEVNKPIVVNKPKKAKNGCVPQRRAKRRSGLESAGEIKADILKKTESVPRRPRRRSSVANDSTQKTNMQHELLSLFLVEDDDSVSLSGNSITNSAASNSSVTNASRPKRDVSPHRWATMPLKPIRRLSEVPDIVAPPSAASTAPSTTTAATRDDTRLLSHLVNRPPTKSTQLADLGRSDSLRSLNSNESTLSDVARRQSDLSSIGEQTTEVLATTFTEDRQLNCSVILEEDEHEQHKNQDQNLQTSSSEIRTNNDSTIKFPRKPMRRVSFVSEDLEGPMPGCSDAGIAQEAVSTTMPAVAKEERRHLAKLDSPSTDSNARERLMFIDTENEDGQENLLIASVNDHSSSTRWTSDEDKPKIARSLSNPVTRREDDERKVGRSESMPKKPMRRVSEAPHSQLWNGITDEQH